MMRQSLKTHNYVLFIPHPRVRPMCAAVGHSRGHAHEPAALKATLTSQPSQVLWMTFVRQDHPQEGGRPATL